MRRPIIWWRRSGAWTSPAYSRRFALNWSGAIAGRGRSERIEDRGIPLFFRKYLDNLKTNLFLFLPVFQRADPREREGEGERGDRSYPQSTYRPYQYPG